jgi:hypothetical protein
MMTRIRFDDEPDANWKGREVLHWVKKHAPETSSHSNQRGKFSGVSSSSEDGRKLGHVCGDSGVINKGKNSGTS